MKKVLAISTSSHVTPASEFTTSFNSLLKFLKTKSSLLPSTEAEWFFRLPGEASGGAFPAGQLKGNNKTKTLFLKIGLADEHGQFLSTYLTLDGQLRNVTPSGTVMALGFFKAIIQDKQFYAKKIEVTEDNVEFFGAGEVTFEEGNNAISLKGQWARVSQDAIDIEAKDVRIFSKQGVPYKQQLAGDGEISILNHVTGTVTRINGKWGHQENRHCLVGKLHTKTIVNDTVIKESVKQSNNSKGYIYFKELNLRVDGKWNYALAGHVLEDARMVIDNKTLGAEYLFDHFDSPCLDGIGYINLPTERLEGIWKVKDGRNYLETMSSFTTEGGSKFVGSSEWSSSAKLLSGTGTLLFRDKKIIEGYWLSPQTFYGHQSLVQAQAEAVSFATWDIFGNRLSGPGHIQLPTQRIVGKWYDFTPYLYSEQAFQDSAGNTITGKSLWNREGTLVDLMDRGSLSFKDGAEMYGTWQKVDIFGQKVSRLVGRGMIDFGDMVYSGELVCLPNGKSGLHGRGSVIKNLKEASCYFYYDNATEQQFFSLAETGPLELLKIFTTWLQSNRHYQASFPSLPHE